VRREKVVIRFADDFCLGLRSQLFPERLAGTDHAALPIFHKKVNPWQMFEKELKLLRTTHLSEECLLKLGKIQKDPSKEHSVQIRSWVSDVSCPIVNTKCPIRTRIRIG
jgi:hypothetical protein